MTGTMKVSVKNILVALSAAFFVLSGAFQTPAAEQPMPALDTEGTCAIQPLHVSVHDPSVILDQDGTCYLFGSHTAIASSKDLIQWEQISSDYGNGRQVPIYGDLDKLLKIPFRWAGRDDGDAAGGYAVWAPDIFWNEQYRWEDGTKGAYMLYLCTSSTWTRSVISFCVAKKLTGPYTFASPIVYSGFTKNGKPDGNSTRSTKWDQDILNLKALKEKDVIDEISDNWFTKDGGWNFRYAPNAIDPNVFFDKDHRRMYLSYGSWSGGIFLLELDPETGLAIYPGVDSTDRESGNFVDRYFGIHLAGGGHAYGEGPYIKYDPESGFYHLFITYGGLASDGGYNMRLFRSRHVSGPYLDAAGRSAADNAYDPDDYGIKLIGNYKFTGQVGVRSAGHNSQLIDSMGNRYLIYHQRFDVKPQLEAHEVRVHQQFLNEDGWPVTAVYEYRGEKPSLYSKSEVVGHYEMVCSGTETSSDMLPTLLLTLNADGSVEGSKTGTWTMSDSGKGYHNLTMKLGNTVYKGLFFRQHTENKDPNAVMTFSAIGDDNTSLWGSRIDPSNRELTLEAAASFIRNTLPKVTSDDLVLPSEVIGCRIRWSSNLENVLNHEGHVCPVQEKTKVTLTAVLSLGGETRTEMIKIRVRPE